MHLTYQTSHTHIPRLEVFWHRPVHCVWPNHHYDQHRRYCRQRHLTHLHPHWCVHISSPLHSVISNTNDARTESFQRYQQETGGVFDENTGLLRITRAQFEKLHSLFYNINGVRVLSSHPGLQVSSITSSFFSGHIRARPQRPDLACTYHSSIHMSGKCPHALPSCAALAELRDRRRSRRRLSHRR